MYLKAVMTGISFVFIFLFGFWLSRSSKPYNVLIFNFHKLISLAMSIFLIATIYQTHKTNSFSPVEILATVATVLIFSILFVTGGLRSVEATGGLENASQSIQTAIAIIHKVFPYMAVLATAVTLFLLQVHMG